MSWSRIKLWKLNYLRVRKSPPDLHSGFSRVEWSWAIVLPSLSLLWSKITVGFGSLRKPFHLENSVMLFSSVFTSRTKARIEWDHITSIIRSWVPNKISTNLSWLYHQDYSNGNDFHSNIWKTSSMTFSINSQLFLFCYRRQTHKGKQGKRNH